MSSNLDIKINIRNLLDYSASLKSTVEEKTLIMMIKSFSYYVLELYGRMIEEAISSNRYKGKWEPKGDPGYIEYLGVTPKGDIIHLMRESLEVKKIGRNFIIRFNNRMRYPGSKLLLSKVIRAIDGGTSKFNARPIFKKILLNINSHILDLWRGYMLMKGVI